MVRLGGRFGPRAGGGCVARWFGRVFGHLDTRPIPRLTPVGPLDFPVEMILVEGGKRVGRAG